LSKKYPKNRLISFLHLFTLALNEISLRRQVNLAKAQEILVNLKNEFKNLLITEYRIYISQELAKEIAEQNNLFPSAIENLILKAKIEFLKDNFQDGLNLIEKAKSFAEKKDLKGLLVVIDKEKDQYIQKLKKWKDLLSSNTTFIEKLELINIESYINEIKDNYMNKI
jgi:hypothetical protein